MEYVSRQYPMSGSEWDSHAKKYVSSVDVAVRFLYMYALWKIMRIGLLHRTFLIWYPFSICLITKLVRQVLQEIHEKHIWWSASSYNRSLHKINLNIISCSHDPKQCFLRFYEYFAQPLIYRVLQKKNLRFETRQSFLFLNWFKTFIGHLKDLIKKVSPSWKVLKMTPVLT